MSILAPRLLALPRRLIPWWAKEAWDALRPRISHLPHLPQLSTFEKVIIANSAIILIETAVGFWVTQHNPEPYHYLIDTGFIALAALLGMAINFALLRAAFGPLLNVLATIQTVARGNLEARADAHESHADAVALARAFNAMLDRLAEARDETAARVLRAQEDERRRLALELHDQTGQSLTALTLHAQAIAQRLAGEPGSAAGQARAQAERLSVLAQATLAEVQALSRQLRPPMLDDLGLGPSLRWLAEDAGERLGLGVRVRASGRERLPAEVETALYRIAQESLTNAVRHGHARRAGVVLRRRERGVTLTVADDGCGFVPSGMPTGGAPNGHASGQGVEGMRERARMLGGRLTLRSTPGHGTVVRASIPLAVASAVPAAHAAHVAHAAIATEGEAP